MEKTITLSTKDELKIYMSPLRQELLRVMSVHGAPMTAKAVATRLQVSASSAQMHIKKLMGLGLLRQDHTELINGIRAVFFALVPVTVNIGQQLSDGLENERSVIAQNILQRTFSSYIRGVETVKRMGIPEQELKQYGDMLSGVVYLKKGESRELYKLILDYIEAHSTYKEDTDAWSYALIAYNASALEKENENRK
ncbi:MAG: helix-turn-helix domain-containing protein [Christensenellales bacterium]